MKKRILESLGVTLALAVLTGCSPLRYDLNCTARPGFIEISKEREARARFAEWLEYQGFPDVRAADSGSLDCELRVYLGPLQIDRQSGTARSR